MLKLTNWRCKIMSNKMLLEIKNLGLINKANLEINKINVIIGKNATGKSTSSKFLYCLLTAASHEGMILANTGVKKRLLNYILQLRFRSSTNDHIKKSELEELQNTILNIHDGNFEEVYNEIKYIAEGIYSDEMRQDYLKELNKIHELIETNKDRTEQYFNIFDSLLDSEYGYSLNMHDTCVNFKGIINNHEFEQKIIIQDYMRVHQITNDYFNYFNYNNVLYIDSFSVLEFKEKTIKPIGFNYELIDKNIPYHLQSLIKKLKKIPEKTVYDDKYYEELIDFKDNIDGLLEGNFIYDNSSEKFLFNKDNVEYPMENTASGLKQLGLLQLLLDTHELKENTFLIMDEPEVNLHPEYQIKLAEILVLAAKELNCTIYLNTHSPFLAEAMEVYAKYYKIYDETNFYLTEKVKDKEKYDYVLMESDDISEVYENLGNPFDTLNKIRFETELRDDLGE